MERRRPLNQRRGIRLLEQNGWTLTRGGKHAVKMEKPGHRPVTLRHHWRPRLRARADGRDSEASGSTLSPVELTARIQHEAGAYWAEVVELPGCFASGRSLDELEAALAESVTLYLQDGEEQTRPTIRLEQMKILVST